jgi:hypothetical protein
MSRGTVCPTETEQHDRCSEDWAVSGTGNMTDNLTTQSVDADMGRYCAVPQWFMSGNPFWAKMTFRRDGDTRVTSMRSGSIWKASKLYRRVVTVWV